MNLATYNKLQVLLDKSVDYVCLASGMSFEEGMTALRNHFRGSRNTPHAVCLHAVARWIYARNQPDSVQPEYFYEILGLIDTREKFNAVFASLPEHEAPELERVLNIFLKKILPFLRFVAWQLATVLPQRRSGGPKSKTPSDEDCCLICDEIDRQNRKVLAQDRMAKKWKVSIRKIQEIWRDRNLYWAKRNHKSDNKGEECPFP